MTRVKQVKIIGLALLIVLLVSIALLCAIPQEVAFASDADTETENILFSQTITTFPCKVDDQFTVGRGYDEDYIYPYFVYVLFGSQTLYGYDYEYYFESDGLETELQLILTEDNFKVVGTQKSYMEVTTESEDYWTLKAILVVHYQPGKYTVTFDSNGGNAISSREVLPYMILSPLPTPTWDGHTFLGWYLNDVEYTDQEIKEDVTLMAVWDVQTVKITFYVDGEKYYEKVAEYGIRLARSDE